MTSTPASLTSGKQPFRFGLKALLLVTTYAGFVCGWLVWFGIEYWHWYGWFSGWFGILAIVYVVFATYRSRHNQHWAVADILNTTWLITAYNIAVGLLHIFGIKSAENFHA